MNEIQFNRIQIADLFQKLVGNEKFCNRINGLHKFNKLNEKAGELMGNEIIMVGGRPGMGKTSFLLNEYLHLTLEQKLPAVFFSIQHSKFQILEKMISILLESEFKLKHLSEEANELVIKAKKFINEHDFNKQYLFADCSLGIKEIQETIIQLSTKEKVKVFFIDSLQGIKYESKNRIERHEEIEIILKRLKELASLYNCTIILSSDISRNVETRAGDRIPQLQDLRSSGAIEIMADKVFFLYRPEYYKIFEDDYGKSLSGILKVFISKNLSGKKEEVILRMNGLSINEI